MSEVGDRQPDVSIVVVGHNSIDWLTRCLDALLSIPDRAMKEVIVVDSGSAPPLAPALASYRNRTRLVTLDGNAGFARACNVARRYITGRRILLLNPDAIIRPGAIDHLVRLLDEVPARGIVTGRLERPDGSLDPYSVLDQPTLWSEFCFATGLSTLRPNSSLYNPETMGGWRRDRERAVGAVTGCVLLMATDLWDEVGGFDPRFFMYGEDVDLSRRVRDRGYSPWFSPVTVATHAGGASSTTSRKTIMVLQGKATLAERSGGPARRALSQALLLAGVAVRAALARVRSGTAQHWADAWARRRDWRHGWPTEWSDVGVADDSGT